MELGQVNIQVERIGAGVEGAKPHEATYTATVQVDFDRLEFSFIAPATLTDRQLITFVLGWLFEALDMEEEEFVKQTLGPTPAPEKEEEIIEAAKETITFAKKWEIQLKEAARRFGPEVRDQLGRSGPRKSKQR